MKLRIKDNSLRFRVSQSELASLVDSGRIEKTIYFASDEHSRLTYSLECRSSSTHATLLYHPQKVTLVLPKDEVKAWGGSDQVGIYTTADVGPHGTLDLLVEKDYACLDLSDADNHDTFPNPGICAAS
jgi:hypothetical protein